VLEEVDQQLFNQLCNNSDHCLCTVCYVVLLSTTSQHYLPTVPESTQQRHTWKNRAPCEFECSNTPHT